MSRVLHHIVAVGMALACACSAPTRYSTNAEVVELDPGPPLRLVLHHDPIPDFRDAAGKVVGMKAMKMAFGLGPGVDATTAKVGDRIQIIFDVDYERPERLVIQQLSHLPEPKDAQPEPTR